MPLPRFSIPDFSVANPLYAGATITVYTIDVAGAKTTTKADLWDANVGGNALANPQTLDSDGKFTVAVYIEEPVIVTISGLSISDHDTGIITTMGNWRGDWVTATVYYANDIVRDGANGANTGNLYHAAETHTSDVWATDLAAAEWVVVVDISSVVTAAAAQASAIGAGLAAIAAQEARKSETSADISVASAVTAAAAEERATERAQAAEGAASRAAQEARKAATEADAAAASAASISEGNLILATQIFH